MKITDEQLKLLNSFKCIRLRKLRNLRNLKNLSIINNFSNARNPNIADILKNNALKEDQESETAYYVIRRKDKIALFFSIKCGLLFDKSIEDYLTELINSKNDKNKIEKLLGKLEKLKYLLSDIKKETNKNIKRVSETYSGIELVHLCSNDNFKNKWESFASKYSIRKENTMAKIFFWHYIVPKVIELNNIIGSKYLYLFAADSTDDRTLVNYYNDLLFEQNKEVSTIKPYYDFSCIFMCQEIANLKDSREHFFNNFNSEIDSFKEFSS